jgi:hypothetical protein
VAKLLPHLIDSDFYPNHKLSNYLFMDIENCFNNNEKYDKSSNDELFFRSSLKSIIIYTIIMLLSMPFRINNMCKKTHKKLKKYVSV